MAAGVPILWQYNFSNFNEKARWALDFKRIRHERRSLLPGSPRSLLLMRGTVPLLELDGERIMDSTRIIAALERRWPEPALYPSAEDQRARALMLEDFFDEHAGHELRRVALHDIDEDPSFLSGFLTTGRGRWTTRAYRVALPIPMSVARRRYRIYPADVEESRAKVEQALDRIEAELQPSGYLVGERFSVADLTAAALLYPLVWAPEVQHPLPGRVPPRLQRWLDALSGRPAMDWIADMYRLHRGSRMDGAAQARPGPAVA